MPNQRHKFRSKQHAMGLSKRSHYCRDCRYFQTQKYKVCPDCGSAHRIYFMSEKEMQRGAELMLMEDAKLIRNLKFQPRFDLRVEGEKVTTYIADAQYINGDDRLVVEDTKPTGDFMTGEAKLKIKLFNAIMRKHGVSLSIRR